MTTTTGYGSWHYNVRAAGLTLEQAVTDALDQWDLDDNTLDTIIGEYRAAINQALPAGVQLCGNEFYGPAYDQDCSFSGYHLDENGRLDIDAIVDNVDFWTIVEFYT